MALRAPPVRPRDGHRLHQALPWLQEHGHRLHRALLACGASLIFAAACVCGGSPPMAAERR
eukprot:9571648-Alexandrium_andersonii.AAC.1